ncbi:heme/hemin ABC transporter substrate-binding protein [Dongshaea marina]|uniref:heme/hemin ABC transporter substrate-binding protein n=1 Tax=Dongshaea marina TaxID=2047966 RepID=UPI000D3E4375|nr:ABC transporter substrate-binding protein [Dongshaea marina]
MIRSTLIIISLLLSCSVLAQSRIVSIGPTTTELLQALGETPQLIAVDDQSKLPGQMKLPRVGYLRALSAEGLLSLNPTRLIGTAEMGPDHTLKLVQSSGVKVTTLDAAPTVQALQSNIRLLAKALDRPQQGQALSQRVATLVEQLEHSPTAPRKRTLFLLLLGESGLKVAGDHSSANTLIQLAGGANPASDLDGYKPASMEALVKMKPEVLLIGNHNWQQLGGTRGLVNAFPMLAATPAYTKRQIYPIDDNALLGGVGLTTLEQAKELREKLYPGMTQRHG